MSYSAPSEKPRIRTAAVATKTEPGAANSKAMEAMGDNTLAAARKRPSNRSRRKPIRRRPQMAARPEAAATRAAFARLRPFHDRTGTRFTTSGTMTAAIRKAASTSVGKRQESNSPRTSGPSQGALKRTPTVLLRDLALALVKPRQMTGRATTAQNPASAG